MLKLPQLGRVTAVVLLGSVLACGGSSTTSPTSPPPPRTTLEASSLSATTENAAGGGQARQGTTTAPINQDGSFEITLDTNQDFVLENTPSFLDKTTVYDAKVSLSPDKYFRIPSSIDLKRLDDAHRNWLSGKKGINRPLSKYVEGTTRDFKYFFVRDGSEDMEGKNCKAIPVCSVIEKALDVLPDITADNYSADRLRVVDSADDGDGKVIFEPSTEGVATTPFLNGHEVTGGNIDYNTKVRTQDVYEHELWHIFGAPGHSDAGLMSGRSLDNIDKQNAKIVYHLRLGNTSPDNDPR